MRIATHPGIQVYRHHQTQALAQVNHTVDLQKLQQHHRLDLARVSRVWVDHEKTLGRHVDVRV
jgi:hypothetical protein